MRSIYLFIFTQDVPGKFKFSGSANHREISTYVIVETVVGCKTLEALRDAMETKHKRDSFFIFKKQNT
jgi:hypothetical protein